jgi:Peptidase family C25/Propeptide_C25
MRIFVIAALLFLLATSFAAADDISVEVIHDDDDRLLLQIDIDAPETTSALRGGEAWNLLNLPGVGHTTRIGYPELPLIHRFVALPPGMTASVSVLKAKSTIVKNIRIAPWQKAATRGGKTFPFTIDKDVYASAELWPPQQLVADKQVVMGGARLLSVIFHPVRVRPASGEATLTTSAVIEVRFEPAAEISRRAISQPFRAILDRRVLNPSALRATRDDEPAARTGYLIICHDAFCDAAGPLAEWKSARGLLVDVVPFSEIGSTTDDLSDYLQDQYDDKGLDYVLLVGDHDHIPTPYGIGETPADHKYTTVDGDDYLADFIIGRITGNNAGEIATQVAKSIAYEKHPVATLPEWFASSINISGSDWDDDENAQYCGGLTEAYGFANVNYFIDSAGTNSSPSVIAAINAGSSWITYFGHGSDTLWTSLDPNMSVNDVLGLNNAGMLPVITSIACSNGAFDKDYDCFAEAWMKTGEQKGAALIFASGRDTPFFYTDELGKALTRAYFEDGIDTYGQAAMQAKLDMYDAFPEPSGMETEEVMQQFLIFGDPHLNPWSAPPLAIEPPGAVALTRGQPANFEILLQTADAPVADARVHLFNDDIDELLATDADGIVTVDFGPQIDLSDVDIVVTKRNILPLTGKLPVEYDVPYDDDLDDDDIDDDDVNDDAADDDAADDDVADDDDDKDADDDKEIAPSGSSNDSDEGGCGLF